MSYVANTMFEDTVSNSSNDVTVNVSGKFGTNTGASFVPDVCSAGTICVRNGLIPSEGYEAIDDRNGGTVTILNGNTWYMNVATDGSAGSVGDHTGLYFCDTYDVQKFTSGGSVVNIGSETLGLSAPSGSLVNFKEAVVGKQYTLGVGNFSTAPSAGVSTGYATISNGFLVYTASEPTTAGEVYFKLLRTKNQNYGTSYWGLGYVVEVERVTSVQVIPKP